MAPSDEDSLYGSSDGYQAVNDWSGVYEVQQPAAQVPQQGASYDYSSSDYSSSYEQPAAVPQPVMDQSYYESVYASYAAPAAPQPEFYAQPEHEQAAYYPQPGYAQPQHPQHPSYEQHNFHHPEFDTGQFEAIYEEPGSTEASYDLLPEGEGAYDAYGEGDYLAYEYEYDGYTDDDYADDEGDYRDGYQGYGDDLAEDEPEAAPLRSRSRSARAAAAAETAPRPAPAGTGSGSPGRPFGSKPGRVPLSGRRTLHAITSTPAAVVGVAAVAVAAVGGLRLPAGHTETAADAASPATPTTNALEQNLLQMRAASANLADRATRSEQRNELAQQSALEKQRLAQMAQKFFVPVQDYILTAGFGDAGARWASLHTGQDFAVPTGTKVVAVTDGTVIEAGSAGAFGNRIVIQHPDGSETWYCHLSVMKVRSGKVAAGQIIALSGDTGNSTGPHLHFEYHPPGPADPMNGVPGASTAVNPVPFLRSHGLVL